MIVKLQRPLIATERNPPWLVYDATRAFQRTLPEGKIPAHVMKAMGTAAKGYFDAVVRNGQVTQWGRRTDDQPW